MRTSGKRMLSLLLTVTMLVGLLLPNLTMVSAAETEESSFIPGIGDASFIKRDGPAAVDWSANWIWGADNTSQHNWMCFRKSVELEAVPETVMARIAVDSRYWLWINGEMVVYEGSVKRGPNSYDTYFDTIEISDYLRKGENTIAILAWYFGADNNSFSYKASGQGGLLFEADLGDVTLVSDDSWKVHRENGYQLSPRINTQTLYRHAEKDIYYDASKSTALEGWYLPEFDDSAWEAAVVYGKAGDAPWNGLWQRSIPMIAWDRELSAYENPNAYDAYKETATTGTVTINMNLPRNMQFQPYLKVEAPAGVEIQVYGDGTAALMTYYVTKEGMQEFEGYGWMSAQTVTYKIPAGVKVLELAYRETGYDAEYAGSFTSEDAFFNRLWLEALYTLDITMRDNYMDCPDRERAQWWGDVTNESHMTFYSLSPDAYYLYRKGVDTVINWRGQTGTKDDRVLCTVVPINRSHFELPVQQLAGVVGFWTYYQYTGEYDFLQQVYEPSLSYLTCWTMSDSGLVNHRPGSWDWLDYGSNPDQVVLENAWYYWACQRVLMMAEELGITEDTDFLVGRMESIKAAYPTLWDESKGAYYNSAADGRADDRGNAIAVLSGLAPEEYYPQILNMFVNIHKASPYMEKYVLDAMYAMDAQTEALDRMKARYSQMVGDKWTTLWEFFPANSSHNHAWTGGPLINLSGNVAGVAPDLPGYETYHVIPQLGYLNNIDCTVPSIKGDIVVSIDRDPDAETYAMTLVSPEATVARVAIPRFAGKNTEVSFGDTVVFADGKAAGTVDGVEYLSNDEAYIYFNVQPGTWSASACVKSAEAAETYSVTIDAGEGGTVTVNGKTVETPYTASYPAGTQLQLNAIADSGMQFENWSGLYGYETAEVTVSVNAPIHLTANFAEIPESGYQLVKITDPNAAGLQVEINGKTRDLPYSAAVKEGEDLTITAVDSEAWNFANWQGDVFSGSRTLTLENVTESVKLEVQGAYKGNVFGNQSLGAAVTVDKEYSSGTQWRASNLTDGVKLNDGGMTTYEWYVKGYDYSNPTVAEDKKLTDGYLPEGEAAEVVVDLGKARTFDTFRIYPRGNYDANGEAVNFMIDYTILVSNDQAEWTPIYEKVGQQTPNNKDYPFVEIDFDAQTARYVKLSVTRLSSPLAEGGKMMHRLQLSELEIYNKKSLPATGTVTIDAAEGGTVLVNGKAVALPFTETYPSGTILALEAQNDTNYKFTGWSGDLSGKDAPAYLQVMSDIEVSALFESTQVKQLETSENLVQGKTVTASSTLTGGWNVSNSVDGTTSTAAGGKGWSTDALGSTDGFTAVTWEADFGSNIDFNSVTLYPRDDHPTDDGKSSPNYPTKFEIQVKLDEETIWRTVESYDIDAPAYQAGAQEYKFALQNARYVRLVISEVSGSTDDEEHNRVQLSEIEVHVNPVTPENLALNATFTASDSYGNNASWHPNNLKDGVVRSTGRNLSTGLKGYTSDQYSSPELSSPIYVNAAFAEAVTCNQIILYPRSDIDALAADSGVTPNFPTKFDVQVQTAAGGYETVASVDYGSSTYNINSAPQVIPFDDVDATDVRLVVYRLGQPAWDESKNAGKYIYRLQLCEMQVGFVPDPEADYADIAEGAITIVTETETVAEPTVFTAEVTESDLADNGIIWSVENADGTVSNTAKLLGTNGLTTTVVPMEAGNAYVVARMANGLKTVAKAAITTEEPADNRVQAVIEAIDAIDVADKATIDAARTAYDTLTDEEKALVTNAAALEAAELHWNTVNGVVSLVLTGKDAVSVSDEEVVYTLSAENMTNLATVVVGIEIGGECLTDPMIEAAGDWYVIVQTQQDGVLNVAVASNSGVSGDGDILTLTMKPAEKAGEATVAITYTEMCAYLGDGETFVSANLDAASVTTTVEHNIFDVNKDGMVDIRDIARAQRWYGTDHAVCDVNDDGEVNIDDLILILNHFSDLFV